MYIRALPYFLLAPQRDLLLLSLYLNLCPVLETSIQLKLVPPYRRPTFAYRFQRFQDLHVDTEQDRL